MPRARRPVSSSWRGEPAAARWVERSANRIGAGCETAFLCQHPAAVGDADRDSRDSSLSGGMRELRNESTQAPVLAALTVQKADGHEQMRRMTIKVPRQPTRAAELSETQECPERCLCTQHG